jgi:hypothetical protein
MSSVRFVCSNKLPPQPFPIGAATKFAFLTAARFLLGLIPAADPTHELSSEEAEQKAKDLARAEQDKLIRNSSAERLTVSHCIGGVAYG